MNHPNIKNPGPDYIEVREARESIGLSPKEAAAMIGWGARRWEQVELDEERMTRQQWELWKHVAGIEAMPFTKRD